MSIWSVLGGIAGGLIGGPAGAAIGGGLGTLVGGGGADQAAQTGLTDAGIAQVAALQAEAEKERQAAIAGATQNWNARQPLRDAAIARLLGAQPGMPDLGGALSDAANPYWHSPGIIPMGGPGPAVAAAPAAAGPPQGTPLPIPPGNEPWRPRVPGPGPGGWVAGGGWLNPGGGALPGLPAGGRGPIASPRFDVTAATLSPNLNRALAQLQV